MPSLTLNDDLFLLYAADIKSSFDVGRSRGPKEKSGMHGLISAVGTGELRSTYTGEISEINDVYTAFCRFR